MYAEYGDKIFRYCLGRLRSREEAEDATQNTFLRVCTALRKGTVPELEGPWLYKIAHNVCLSRRLGSSRRARVETPADLDALGERAAAHTPDADELFGLGEALAEMPSNLRRPLLLREWQGMSYMEIADALGVSHSAVETLIFRARRHLAQALIDPVKKTGRAVVSIFNIRWLYGLLKSLGGGAGSGLVAGAAGIVVAIGGGVAVDLAVQQASTSQRSASSTQVAQAVAATRAQTATTRGAGAESSRSGAAAAGLGGAAQVAGRAGAGPSATAAGAQSPAASSVAAGASSIAAPATAAAASSAGRRSTAASPASTRTGANGTGSAIGGSNASPPGSSKAPPPPVAPPTIPDPGSLLPPVDVPSLPPPPARSARSIRLRSIRPRSIHLPSIRLRYRRCRRCRRCLLYRRCRLRRRFRRLARWGRPRTAHCPSPPPGPALPAPSAGLDSCSKTGTSRRSEPCSRLCKSHPFEGVHRGSLDRGSRRAGQGSPFRGICPANPHGYESVLTRMGEPDQASTSAPSNSEMHSRIQPGISWARLSARSTRTSVCSAVTMSTSSGSR